MTLPLWVDYAQAVGGIATAVALILIGIQTFVSRRQTALMQEQIGRAWIGASSESLNTPKVRKESDRSVLYCKNYGNIPAKIVWVKSAIQESEPKESDLRISSHQKTIIFPGHERKFSTGNYPNTPPGPYQETSIWFMDNRNGVLLVMHTTTPKATYTACKQASSTAKLQHRHCVNKNA